MNIPQLLSKVELAQSRTPAQLLSWVKKKCEELGSTQESKRYACSGSVFPKKFYDEIFPLALFAWKEFGDRDDVLVTPNLSNDNFDGTIDLLGNQRVRVEVTCAKDGHDESLRMEVLAKAGHVNTLALPINIIGTRHSQNREVTVPDEAVNHADVIAQHLGFVQRCLISKSNVVYGRDHILVLVVDDYLPFRSENDVQTLTTFAADLLCKLSLDFGQIVALGTSDQLFVKF